MVVDSSALVAVVLREADRERFLDLITQAETLRISAANVLETGIVLEARGGEPAGRELDLFLHQAGFEIVPVDAELVDVARLAWRRFGKGRHPAGLNLCDCFAYALAKMLDEPLLASGLDFRKTDIRLVDFA